MYNIASPIWSGIWILKPTGSIQLSYIMLIRLDYSYNIYIYIYICEHTYLGLLQPIRSKKSSHNRCRHVAFYIVWSYFNSSTSHFTPKRIWCWEPREAIGAITELLMATGRTPAFQSAVEAWLDMFREECSARQMAVGWSKKIWGWVKLAMKLPCVGETWKPVTSYLIRVLRVPGFWQISAITISWKWQVFLLWMASSSGWHGIFSRQTLTKSQQELLQPPPKRLEQSEVQIEHGWWIETFLHLLYGLPMGYHNSVCGGLAAFRIN